MTVSEDKREWLRWKWEFLRRDPEYIRAYKERHRDINFSGVPRQEPRMLGLWPFELCKLMNENDRSRRRMKYLGWNTHVSPDTEFEDIPEEQLSGLESWDSLCMVVHPPTEQSRWLEIRIDPTNINRVDVLKAEICHLIDAEMAKVERKRQTRKVDYELIYTTGTMREKGMTYRQIAQKIFPRDYNIENDAGNPESAETKVKQYVKRFQELSNGGHLFMSYP